MTCKFEIRISKSETNTKFKFLNDKNKDQGKYTIKANFYYSAFLMF
jgi:hypothetical protein